MGGLFIYKTKQGNKRYKLRRYNAVCFDFWKQAYLYVSKKIETYKYSQVH